MPLNQRKFGGYLPLRLVLEEEAELGLYVGRATLIKQVEEESGVYSTNTSEDRETNEEEG